MQIPMKFSLSMILSVLLITLSPFASAHGLDGHHAPFMSALWHLFFEHGYLLGLLIGIGMVWYAVRDHGRSELLKRFHRIDE